MQLNIYLPKHKEKLLGAINRVVKKKNTTNNKLVLEAVEKYLDEQLNQDFEFGVYHLKAGKMDRENIYREHLNRKVGLEEKNTKSQAKECCLGSNFRNLTLNIDNSKWFLLTLLKERCF